MLFEEDIPEQKGLFTFYRQQQEKEEQLKRLKKLKKQLNYDSLNELINPEKRQAPFGPSLKTTSHRQKKQLQFKSKIISPKLRLHESVVDMAKQIQQDKYFSERYQLEKPRFKEPTFLAKSKKHKDKVYEISYSSERQCNILQEESIADDIKIESQHLRHHRRQSLDDLNSSRAKAAIHDEKGSVCELPQLKKYVEMPYKPKKNIKSKLIQDALKCRDKDKIRSLRNQIKQISVKHQPFEEIPQFDLENTSFTAFQHHQLKLLNIMKRFKKA